MRPIKRLLVANRSSLLQEEDLEAARTAAARRCGRAIDDRDLASWLTYPDVFTQFCGARAKYGPVWALPKRAFFYSLAPGEEISAEIESGKTLRIRHLAISEADEAGQVQLFFEVNGQPRTISMRDRSKASIHPKKRKAEEGGPKHFPAPISGVITTVSVVVDQKAKAREPLFSIEAMKMESQLAAPVDGVVGELLVRPGEQAEAKDLLMAFM